MIRLAAFLIFLAAPALSQQTTQNAALQLEAAEELLRAAQSARQANDDGDQDAVWGLACTGVKH